MDRKVSFAYLLVISLQLVHCVRISPKLDFGNDNTQDSAKIRPNFQSRSFGNGNRDHNKIQGINITCANGDCNITEKQGGVATDVLVHIKTNSEVDTKNNSKEAVPDIPVIIGTKTNEFPVYNSPLPFNDLPPLPVTTLFRNPLQQTEPRINNGVNYHIYDAGYQGNRNVPDSYRFNNELAPNNNFQNPQFNYNNKRPNSNVGSFNPLEFKKVYINAGSDLPMRWMESAWRSDGRGYNDPSNRQTCVCPNPQEQLYQPSYPRY